MTVSRLSVRLSVTVSRLLVTVSRLSVSVTIGLLWGIPMRVQLLLSILASQSDMAIIIRSKGTHVLVYGAVFDITTINYSLNASYSHWSTRASTKFLKYILGYMLYVRKSVGEREGWYFRR